MNRCGLRGWMCCLVGWGICCEYCVLFVIGYDISSLLCPKLRIHLSPIKERKQGEGEEDQRTSSNDDEYWIFHTCISWYMG